MIGEFLKALSVGLHLLLLGALLRLVLSQYGFPLWRRAWGFLLLALVLQTERRIYELYWLPWDLRNVLVALAIASCMLISMHALYRLLRGDHLTLLSSPTAHIVVDQFSVILAWDRTAEQIFGWSAAEAIGQTLMQTVIVPRDWEAHRVEMAHVRETARPAGIVILHNYAVNARHKSGAEIHVEMTVSVETWSDGAQTLLVEVRRLGRL